MKPRPTPAERVEMHERHPARSLVRHPWHEIRLGHWQEWLHLPDDAEQAEAERQAKNLRASATDYARRHGLRVESRASRRCRTVDLRFTRRSK